MLLLWTLPISEYHESSIIYGWNIQRFLIIMNVSETLAYGFYYCFITISIQARPYGGRQTIAIQVRTYRYVVDFREGIIIGNFLWRICAQYPIPFSLVLFLFSNPNERTCLVCIAISIYWLSSVRFATYSLAVFLFGYSFDIKTECQGIDTDDSNVCRLDEPSCYVAQQKNTSFIFIQGPNFMIMSNKM